MLPIFPQGEFNMSNIKDMSLRGFFKDNVKKPSQYKVVVSNRMCENGKPIEWIIRPLTGAEFDEMQSKATEAIIDENGEVKTRVNEEEVKKYLFERVVLFPDLMNAQLQDEYGVQTAKDLVGEMLTADEYSSFSQTIQKYCGLTAKVNTVAELKN